MIKKSKIYVGVSGGVDSSVALAILKNQGYDVTGVFLKVWNPDFLECNWREERRSAMRVCSSLGVPFKTLDCEKEYKEKIVDYMISEYKIGKTPNPDVFCNKYIKFGLFLDKAIQDGADFIATGHYARNIFNEKIKKFELFESSDKEKDQSYFLSQINQKQLSKAMFPIGIYKKEDVRKMAKNFNLPTYNKKDSQGLCFIGKIDMEDFLKHFIKQEKGDVLDINGNVIGVHNGSVFYTIGQRHNFQIFKNTKNSEKLFVISKDVSKNTITVSQTENIKGVDEIIIKNINIFDENLEFGDKYYDVCFRYHQKKQKCRIEKIDTLRFRLIPTEKQKDLASGQIAVIYSDEKCVLSGVIE